VQKQAYCNGHIRRLHDDEPQLAETGYHLSGAAVKQFQDDIHPVDLSMPEGRYQGAEVLCNHVRLFLIMISLYDDRAMMTLT